jgi:hypothetical protein
MEDPALNRPHNAFVRKARKVYNALGFSKGYNFVLCMIRPFYIWRFLDPS